MDVESLQYRHRYESIGLPIAIALRFFICNDFKFCYLSHCMQVVAHNMTLPAHHVASQEERTQYDVSADWSSYFDVYVTGQDVHEQSVGSRANNCTMSIAYTK
jgi:hypothetical protein